MLPKHKVIQSIARLAGAACSKTLESAKMSRMIGNWLGAAADNFNWLIQEMDITQWGIVSAIFVFTGFMALRTRF